MGSPDLQIKAVAEWKCLEFPLRWSSPSTEGYEETLGVTEGGELI